MGASAAIPGSRLRVVPEGNTIKGTDAVREAHLDDHYRIRFDRHNELLEREHFLASVTGFESRASYTRPLLKTKQFRSLGCLDNVTQAFSEDQIRQRGYSEVQVPQLAEGPATALCMLDTATVVCASADGPIWVYNWLESHVVSKMRDPSDKEQELENEPPRRGPARDRGPGFVQCLCQASEDGGLLGSGDSRGIVAVWDLREPTLACEVRIHEAPVTGLAWEETRPRLVTTSADTYILVFDIEKSQVVDRGVPKSMACGCGVPNTTLTLGMQGKLALVGGLDGKLRVWSKEDGMIQRQSTLLCGGAAPSKCQVAADGWSVIVATRPADPAFCDGQVGNGGLLYFDIRKMTSSEQPHSPWNEHPALVTSQELPASVAGTEPGAQDLALMEVGGEHLALCLSGVSVKAYDLLQSVWISDDCVGTNLAERWDMDVVERPVWQTPEYNAARPCHLACKDRVLVTATSAPLVDFWHWVQPHEAYGHDEYEPEQDVKPLSLRSRLAPLASKKEDEESEPALNKVLKALELDRERLGE